MTRCSSCPIRLQDPLIINILGKTLFISYFLWVVMYFYGDVLLCTFLRKVASQTNTFSWVWPGVSLVQSDWKIIWSLIYLKWVNSYFRVLTWRWSQRKGSIWVHPFWLDFTRCALHPYLWIQYLWSSSDVSV